ncbi:MAG TPA: DNA replication and repair protein RecF, partial [Candidatus Saccharimonadaceae bacterium]|nr:DNA replication and repair protein RecF [Candidatus Saccharimonadaceae bacterium]
MSIREIRLSNVRSYELFSAQLNPGVSLILGKNGTGKTTLLEGLYFLAHGTSFRGRDRDMIAHDSTRADVMTVDDEGRKRRASLQLTPDDKVKKAFTIGNKSTARLPAAARQPTVLFEPDELRLLSSSPDRRRRFFDGLLTRLYPQYATLLARYQRILLQRNELLKQYAQAGSTTSRQASFRGRSAALGFTSDTSVGAQPLLRSIDDSLFTWDIKFAETAANIVDMRRNFVALSNSHLSRLYSAMAGSDHRVSVSYTSSLPAENYQQKLLDTLYRNRLSDSYRGYTTSGPHRDDFSLFLDSHSVAETASRGEMRTIMLAYKLLEV